MHFKQCFCFLAMNFFILFTFLFADSGCGQPCKYKLLYFEAFCTKYSCQELLLSYKARPEPCVCPGRCCIDRGLGKPPTRASLILSLFLFRLECVLKRVLRTSVMLQYGAIILRPSTLTFAMPPWLWTAQIINQSRNWWMTIIGFTESLLRWVIDLSHNDVKRGKPDVTRSLFGSAKLTSQ